MEEEFEVEWEGSETADDGKQSDFATGAAHNGCCKK